MVPFFLNNRYKIVPWYQTKNPFILIPWYQFCKDITTLDYNTIIVNPNTPFTKKLIFRNQSQMNYNTIQFRNTINLIVSNRHIYREEVRLKLRYRTIIQLKINTTNIPIPKRKTSHRICLDCGRIT